MSKKVSRQHACIRRRFSSGNKKKNKKKSLLWMNRHVQDPFVRRAKEEGHVSRAVYKLEQIDAAHRLLLRSKQKQFPQCVLDLGAAPGGWTSYVASRLTARDSIIVAIDLLPLHPRVQQQLVNSALTFHAVQGDFTDKQIQQHVLELLTTSRQHQEVDSSAAVGGAPAPAAAAANSTTNSTGFHLILSDAAANFTGDSQTDALRTMGLCESALQFSKDALQSGGSLVCKYFSCPEEVDLKHDARLRFQKVHVVKPRASRSESAERYLVAKGFSKEEDL